jgi:hypothetical protein
VPSWWHGALEEGADKGAFSEPLEVVFVIEASSTGGVVAAGAISA